MKVGPGDAILFKGKANIFVNLIKRFTQSEWFHAGMVLDFKSNGMMVYIDSTLKAGVNKKVAPFDKDKHAIYRHEDINGDKRNIILNEVRKYIGRKYDVLGLLYRCYLTVTFQRRKKNLWNNKNRVFCSELVADVYDKAGLLFDDTIPVSNIAPANIARSKKTERIC